MKFYALVSKQHHHEAFHEPLVVSDEIQFPQKRGQVCVEITIAQPGAFFDGYEILITDHYDRLFELAAEIVNQGVVRLVSEQEMRAWENEIGERIPLP